MFKGIQKVSLVDYPGLIAATLFTGGCNFRCSWCHNWDLVEPERLRDIPDLEESEVKDYLVSRKGKIQGICVTGGEPTLWGEALSDFLAWCHSHDFRTKLDTNGSHPDKLALFLDSGTVDFIAMDIKNIFSKYPRSVGLDEVDVKKIEDSIDMIRESEIEHLFRCTVVPGLVDQKEMDDFARKLGIAIHYQEYRRPGRY